MNYEDTKDMTPLERKHILGFIQEEIERQNKIVEEQNRQIQQQKANRNNRGY